MPLSKRLRFEILRRDNHTCRYCGQSAPDVKLSVDHVLPVALGGTDDPDNLVAACVDCNSGKSSGAPDQSVVQQVSADAMRYAHAVKAAGIVLAKEAVPRKRYIAKVDKAWMSHIPQYKAANGRDGRPKDWRQSIGHLYDRQLPVEMVLDALDVTWAKPYVASEWAYFMGVCWKKLSAVEELARKVFEAGVAADGETA